MINQTKAPNEVAYKITLEKASPELGCIHTQMVLGAVAFLLVSAGIYFCTLTAPHAAIQVASHYSHGARAHALLTVPVILLSPQFLAVGTTLLMWGCALLVGLITLELTGEAGNRLGAAPAIWAGLLFLAYPLHCGPLLWTRGGWAVMLSTFLMLAASYTFRRFCLLKESGYWAQSIIYMFLALCADYDSAVLPVLLSVFTAISIASLPKRNIDIVSPFKLLILLVATVAAFCIFCAMIGGFTGVNPFNFAGLSALAENSLVRFFGGIDVQIPSATRLGLGIAIALGALASFALRIGSRRCDWRIPALLVIWQAFGLLLQPGDSFHFSQETDSFFASVPLSIIISLAFLPAVDSITRRTRTAWTAVGTCALLILLGFWSTQQAHNHENWLREAAKTAQQPAGSAERAK